MQEIWKPIPGAEAFYEISNFGRIKGLPRQRRGVSKAGREFLRNIPEFILKPAMLNSGYFSARLTTESGEKASGQLVHRIVASAFVPNPKNLPWVNHKDGVKTNNHAENLEWCTPSENMIHAVGAGLIPILVGSQRGTAKLNEDKVHVIKKMMLLGFSNEKLAEIFEVSTAPISYIRNNQAWTHVPW